MQGCVTLVAISTLVLSAVTGYRSLCIVAWTYGLGLGGYRYTMKMFTLERVKGKHFTKAWGKFYRQHGLSHFFKFESVKLYDFLELIIIL